MKTLSQVSRESGIAKNKLYRYATKHCSTLQRSATGSILLDAEQESLVLELILANSEPLQSVADNIHSVAGDAQRSDAQELLEAIKKQYENENLFLKQQIEVLNKELDIKNSQIENLMEIQRANQVLLHQAAETKELPGSTLKDTKKGLFARIFNT